jgi:hypothetical protein
MAATSYSAPHSRWLLRDTVDRLAASHAQAMAAISTLNTAAERRRDRARAYPRIQPPLRQRIVARQNWLQTVWFGLVLVAAASFLSWISIRLIAHFAPAPVFVAVIPGVLLAAAVGGAARYTTHSIKGLADRGIRRVLPSSFALAAASAGVVTWITLWLVFTSSTPIWSSVIFAIALTVAAVVATVTCSFLEGPPRDNIPSSAAGTNIRSQPPRHLRVRQRRARNRLDDHTRKWRTAAHRYAVMIPDTGRLEEILAGLVAGNDEHLPLDGLDPYDVMILSALRNYHPAKLAAGLDAASAKLADDP